MSQQQLAALNQSLKNSPLEIGGDLSVQRPLFERAYALTEPIPDSLTVKNATIGGVPVVSIDAKSGGNDGTILLFHGGGFAVGTAASSIRMALQLTRKTGMRTLSVDYRLAPEFPFPAAIEDARAVFEELLASGTSPAPTSIWGISAGGAIALDLALHASVTPVSSLVLLSPWLDLGLSGETMRSKAHDDVILSREGLHTRVLDYIGDADPSDPAISPLFANPRGLPPVLLQVGSAETLLDDSLRLAVAASRADVEVTLDVIPNAPHVSQSAAAAWDEAADALDRACRFAREHLVGARRD